MSRTFDNQEAFQRNLGWITENEAKILEGKHVAIAGVGGVGGGHALTLTRLGIGKLTLADPDIFELVNFNRQAGAMLSTLGRSKVDAIADMALDINPNLKIRRMNVAVNGENIDEFLEGVDLYIDGIDFWALEARSIVFKKCAEKNIPAVTAAPLGMGAAVLCFHPQKMSFETYFRFEGLSDTEKAYHFLVGLAPRFLHSSYLVDPSRVNLKKQYGPSTPMACQICAGIACTEALKILLDRGDVRWAPKGLQFDAYRNKMVKTWRPFGFYNPLQLLTLSLLKFQLNKKK